MSRRERILLSVQKGALVPYDEKARELLRDRGYSVGDILSADLRKPRNPRFHRLVHAIGQLCCENLTEFYSLDAHEAIKKLQVESGTSCERQVIEMPGIGKVMVSFPKSISFASMDEGQFKQFARSICAHISAVYWPELPPEKVEEMAEAMIDQ